MHNNANKISLTVLKHIVDEIKMRIGSNLTQH